MPKKSARKASKPSRSSASRSRTRSTSTGVATKATQVTPEMSFVQLLMLYVVMFIVNSVVVLVANTLFPNLVVLGTHLYSPLQALLQSMAVFSLIVVAASPIIESMAGSMRMKLSFEHWMVLYFFINAAGLWITARFAEMLGLGIASFMTVLALALVLDIAQGAAMKLSQND
jgi:hypothetical protein